MKVSDFLAEQLYDNNSGLRVGPGSDNRLDDNACLLDRATRFIRLVEERVDEAIKGSDTSLMLRFGEEFEFSRDQEFLRISGEGFRQGLCIRTGNIIGTVRGRIDGETHLLRVTSRFGPNLLHRMIAESEGFLELERLSTPTETGDADWLLWFLWKVRLKSTFALGLPKLYINKVDILPAVRGNLDVNALLRIPQDLGRYLCRFREHSYDNAVTRLVNLTFHYLAKHDRATELLADMSRIRSAFREACGDERRRDFRGEIRGIRNPYFAAYNEVAKLSRFILADAGAAVAADQDEFSAVLFDISLLFEHYIRKLLRRDGLSLEPKLLSHPVRYPTGNGRMAMRPDIVLHGSRRTLVLDVKYKRWEWWRKNYEVKRADLFQVMSYAAAYRGHFGDRETELGYGLVFPTPNSRQEVIKERFAELDMDFFIFFFRVPANDADDFGEQIGRQEVRFRREVRQAADETEIRSSA